MIPRISSSSISFEAKKTNSTVRDLYNAHLSTVSQTAQKQANVVASPTVTSPSLSKTLNRPIPMQGIGQKLDTIA